jgi:NADPH:quinone reductase-like Zn-dependent oxidoreductase
MATHPAVVTVHPGAPLQILQVPTPTPVANEVLVHVEWTASTPLDLHQSDGHLLVTAPQVLGDGVAGTVISVGPTTARLKPGDKVFGFTWRSQKEKAHQKYACAAENLLALLPEGFTMQEAVTLGNNFVSAYHTLVMDLGFRFPWPKPKDFVPKDANAPVLIWGGASSVGQYAIQLLKYFGHTQILTTASPKNHELLASFGATKCFNYNEVDVSEQILHHAASLTTGHDAGAASIPCILDCIGASTGSVLPLTRIAQSGSKVAILLPIIISPSAPNTIPTYSMDTTTYPWAPNVTTVGVRTHFYLDNAFHAEHLQPTIMPAMLSMGIIKPNRVRIVDGATMLERAENALALLRKGVSGERLVWRVADD